MASHQLRISFTFSFGYIILGYQSSSVPTVFCIWIIYIWSKDTQRNQSLKTTVAPNLKYKIDKIAQETSWHGFSAFPKNYHLLEKRADNAGQLVLFS